MRGGLSSRPKVADDAVDAAAKRALAPFETPTTGATAENPYTLQLELQQTMNDLVGIIRKADEITEALGRLDQLRERFKHIHVEGHRQYNPGWNLAIDLRNLLLVSECVAKAALERTESRGGHTRDDHPSMDSSWRKVLLVCRAAGGDDVIPDISVTHKDQVPMPSRPPRGFRDLRVGEVLHRRRAGGPPRTERLMTYNATMRVWRGDESGGGLQDFTVEVNEGEVVLDIIHRLQQTPRHRTWRSGGTASRQVRLVLGRGQLARQAPVDVRAFPGCRPSPRTRSSP